MTNQVKNSKTDIFIFLTWFVMNAIILF